MWSVGALLELADRKKLEEFLRAETSLNLPKIHPGSGDTIFEYVVNEDTGSVANYNACMHVRIVLITTKLTTKLLFDVCHGCSEWNFLSLTTLWWV